MARFSLSWLPDELRQQAWREMVRVGSKEARFLATEYDWTMVDGCDAYLALVNTVTQVLNNFGFAPDYGARLGGDIHYQLDVLNLAGYTIREQRRKNPASTIEDKKTVTDLTTKSLITALRNSNSEPNLEIADQMENQVQEVLTGPIISRNVILPDIVSAIALPENRPKKMSMLSFPPSSIRGELGLVKALQQSPDLNAPTVWVLGENSLYHPLRKAARRLLSEIYTKYGYFDGALSPAELQAATDPHETYARSVVYVATNKNGEAVTNTRLVLPTQDGLSSLPTGKKLIDKYGWSLLPTSLGEGEVAEISAMVSDGFNPFAILTSIIALFETAKDRQIDHIIYGAVSGKPEKRFDRLFGDTIIWMELKDGQDANVTVKGPGYRPEGIKLQVAYTETARFLDSMIDYYKRSNEKFANYIVELCQALRAKR
jgi:hypothetical protein